MGRIIKILILSIIIIFITSCQTKQNDKVIGETEHQLISYNEKVGNNTGPNIQTNLSTLEKGNKVQQLDGAYVLTPNEVQKRWNAIADEIGSQLYVSNFEVSQNNHIQNTLTPNLTLIGTLNEEEQLKSITVVGKPTSEEECFTMFNAWNHVVLLANPTFSPDDVSDIFHRFGIETSANLSTIQPGIIEYKGTQFKLDNNNQTLSFTANIQK